jgi:hypothetical protein
LGDWPAGKWKSATTYAVYLGSTRLLQEVEENDTRDSDWTGSAGTQLTSQQDAREPEEAREEACDGSGQTDIGQGETVSSSRRCIQSPPHSRPRTNQGRTCYFI